LFFTTGEKRLLKSRPFKKEASFSKSFSLKSLLILCPNEKLESFYVSKNAVCTKKGKNGALSIV